MQAFDCNGIWWLPEKPSEKMAGTLHFSDDTGIALKLSGILGEPTASFQTKAIPIILGLVYDCPLGRVVTLRDCRIQTVHLSSPGLTREEYFVGRLFVGAHLETEQDFSFSDLRVSLSGLSSWADVLTGLDSSPVPAGKSHQNGFEMRWLQPEPISGTISGGKVTLRVSAKVSTSRREGSIRENVQICLACKCPGSDSVLSESYVYPLQNLMTLATDHPNVLVEFIVRRPGNQEDIHVLAARVFHDTRAATGLFPDKMLFSLADVRDRAVELIGKWIEVSQRQRGVCYPYFGILYKPDSFQDIKFLAVYQSLEVYDRIRKGGIALDSASTGPSRGEHLKRLLNEHAVTIGPLFGDDVQGTIDKVLRFRNFVVHRDSEIGDDPDYGRDLFWLTQRLMFLIKACFLTELVISVEDQLKFFQRNQMYLHILGLTGE